MLSHGIVGDGRVPNDSLVDLVLKRMSPQGAILLFPRGVFLFNKPIDLPNNVVIKGQGAGRTTFLMDLDGRGHSVSIQGSKSGSEMTHLTEPAYRDSGFVMVANPALYAAGDWVQIVQEDSDLVTSSWAQKNVWTSRKDQKHLES